MGKRKKRADGEGSVFRKREDLWGAYIVGEDGKRKYFYSKTQQGVLEKLAAAREEKRRGMLIIVPQQTLVEYLAYWLEHNVRSVLRARTYERYEGIVRLHIVPVLGKVKLQALTPQHVNTLKSKKLKEGLSSKTVGLIYVVLHKALDDAVKLGLIARNVCDAVSPPREEETEIEPLDGDQIGKLLDAAKGHSQEALFILALATGMRRGELLGLKWRDIDFTKGVLHVRRILSRVPVLVREDGGEAYVEAEPKTKSSRRSIVLADFAKEALQKHHVRQGEMRRDAGELWEDHDYVFCTPLGRHLSPGSSVLDVLKTLLKRAGLPDIRFHDLRHSTATLLFSKGVHPKMVQEILGHSDISMTMNIYSHVLPTIQEDAVHRLNQAFKEWGDKSELEESSGQEKEDEEDNPGV